jgi:hypothetical protein
MPTLVRDPPPPEFEALLERRRRLGLDRFYEVCDGVRHMNLGPSSRHGDVEWQVAAILRPLAIARGLDALGQFNVGSADDHRLPNGGIVRPGADTVFLSTAELVLEVVSPGDESWEKFDFSAAHGVREVVIVDPEQRAVHWFGLGDGRRYRRVERSAVVGSGRDELGRQIEWP